MYKTVSRLLPCPVYDVEAVESWLGDLAGEGLYLERHGLSSVRARFRRGEPRALPYRLVSSLEHPTLWQRLRRQNRPPSPEALDLAAHYGWEYVGLYRAFHIYRGTTEHPREMETDPALQRAAMGRVFRWYAARFLLALGVLVGAFLLLWFSCGRSLWGLLLEGFATTLLFPVILAVLALFYGKNLRHFRHLSRKLAAGDALDHRKPWRSHGRPAVGWTLLVVLLVGWWAVGGTLLSGVHSLPAEEYSLARAEDLLPPGYAYQKEPESFSQQRRPNPAFPQDLFWMEDGTLTAPDGRTCPGQFRLRYTRVTLLAAAQWRFAALSEEGGQQSYAAEALSLPGMDEALVLWREYGLCLLLRRGTEVWQVSFTQLGEELLPLEDWAGAFWATFSPSSSRLTARRKEASHGKDHPRPQMDPLPRL